MVSKLLPLVGRDIEEAALARELRRASAGEFRCVVLVGEPGVGKSRLAAEVLNRQRRHAVTLSARAYPLGETTPFGLWAEALEGHLRSLTPEEVLVACDGVVDDLAGLLGSAASARGGAPEQEPPRVRVLAALAILVRRLAAAAPLTIVLDDVHQADASSWEALAYLGRNLRETGVLVVATARSTELADQQLGSQILFALEQDAIAERLELMPLSRQGVGELVHAALDEPPAGRLVAWLADRSRGNPLYVLGLLQALVDEGADLRAPQLDSVPQPLAERIRARVGLLDEMALGVLETVALVGHRVVLGQLARLSARPLDALAHSLDRLVRCHLLAEEEQGHEVIYEIAHPLVQEAIYEGIGRARRMALHRQLARNLLASGFVGEAAPHFVRSAAVGDPEAIEALVAAIGQAEGRGAYREALLLLNALVDLLPAGDQRWLAVLDVIARPAEWVIDHRADAHAVMGIAAMRALDAMLGPGDPGRRAAVKFRLMSFLAWGTGQLAEAKRVCHETIELLGQAGDRRGALLATNEAAWVEGLGGDWAAMETTARAVGSAAEADGELGVAMRADAAVGFSALWRGAFVSGEEAFRRSLSTARRQGSAYEVCRSLSGLGPLLALEGRVDEALLVLEEGRASGPEVRDSLLVEYATIVHWLAGNFAAALESTREAVGSDLIGKRRAFGLVFGALSAAEMGQVREARQYLATASEAYRDGEWALFGDYCRFADAVLDWRADGRIELGDLRHTCLRILGWRMPPFAAFPLLDLVEAATEAGDADLAREGAAHLADISALLDRRPYRGLSALGEALVGLAQGVPTRAAERARAASDLLCGTGMEAFEGRALDALGRALSATDRAGAVVAFAEAARLFERGGAAWRRKRALGWLERLGQPGRRLVASMAGPLPLTAREREIARLASRGSTSREIAERLFLSERTVETHLSHVYGKLGVRSKTELARRAADLDL
jgi:DNA-binding CsgD family transcriptional regulator